MNLSQSAKLVETAFQEVYRTGKPVPPPDEPWVCRCGGEWVLRDPQHYAASCVMCGGFWWPSDREWMRLLTANRREAVKARAKEKAQARLEKRKRPKFATL